MLSKTFLFHAILFSQTVLIQTFQFIMRIAFILSQLNLKTVLFQTIQVSVSTISISKPCLFQTILLGVYTQFTCQNSSFSSSLNVRTVIFQIFPFNMSTHFSSIWSIDWTFSDVTTPEWSGPGSICKEGVFHIPPKLQYQWSLTIR